MTNPTIQHPTVLDSILEWSLDRPNWQRDAIRRIVLNGKLDETDIAELVKLCMADNGIPQSEITAMPLAQEHLPSNPSAGESVILTGIRDVKGVNHLAPNQNLEFSPTGLTVVYGDNGSGKSGYSRILKRICRTRNRGEKLLGNVYAKAPENTQEAFIDYQIGGHSQAPVHWSDTEKPHPHLSAIGVFDSSCIAIHIGSKNEIAARPFGLDIPYELAEACKNVEASLKSELRDLRNRRHPIFDKPPWKATTEVGKALNSLTANSSVDYIRSLAKLSRGEASQIKQLRQDLTTDPAVGARQARLRASRIKNLVIDLNNIAETLSDASLATIRTTHEAAQRARKAARIAAENLFSASPLPGVGESVWKDLWESARRYSESRAYPDEQFPPKEQGLNCVLCQQPLSQAAIERMQSFEDFLKTDTEKTAQAAERAGEQSVDQLYMLKTSTRQHKVPLEDLNVENGELAVAIRRLIASARLRRTTFFKSLKQPEAVYTLLPVPEIQLEKLSTDLEDRAEELEKLADPSARELLQKQLDELEDRESLAGVLTQVEEEFVRLATIAFLDGCCRSCNTTAITHLGNKLADEVVTPQLRDRFSEEVTSLVSSKIRVELMRVGGEYGSPQYQVRLLASPDTKVVRVLSEGEQTCIGLAAFLTEVATMHHQSALIFDDPVSSLDHRWRKRVAERLAKEAKLRQIIVFTHDLIFVNDLIDLASRNQANVICRSLQRGATGTGNVEDGLPWQAKSVEDRLDKLKKRAGAAKQLFEESRDEEYLEETTAIYSRLRATWERALESIAFGDVIRRHRDYIKTKDLKKTLVLTDSDCETFDAGFKKCSEVTDAHDPSMARNAQPPAPSEVLRDIESLSNWVKSLRDRQKHLN